MEVVCKLSCCIEVVVLVVSRYLSSEGWRRIIVRRQRCVCVCVDVVTGSEAALLWSDPPARAASFCTCQYLTQTPGTGLRHPWRKVPESDARSVYLTQTPSTGLRHPWRKVPESDARSVYLTQTPSTGLRHPWRKVPESDARSVYLTLTLTARAARCCCFLDTLRAVFAELLHTTVVGVDAFPQLPLEVKEAEGKINKTREREYREKKTRKGE